MEEGAKSLEACTLKELQKRASEQLVQDRRDGIESKLMTINPRSYGPKKKLIEYMYDSYRARGKQKSPRKTPVKGKSPAKSIQKTTPTPKKSISKSPAQTIKRTKLNTPKSSLTQTIARSRVVEAPVGFVDPSSCKGILRDIGYTVSKELGRGSYGSVFLLCKKFGSDCTDVVKFQDKQHRSAFEREVAAMRALAPLGICPPIEQWGSCENKYYIVMPKLDITLNNYLKQKHSWIQLRNLYTKVRILFQALARSPFCHGDAHVANIMLKLNEDGSVEKAYFVDFGLGFPRASESKRFDRQSLGWKLEPDILNFCQRDALMQKKVLEKIDQKIRNDPY